MVRRAWGYHFYTISAITPLVEAGERCGLGLYAYEHQGRQFKGLFDGPLNLAMPDLVLPAFNDSGTVGLRGARPTRLRWRGTASRTTRGCWTRNGAAAWCR